MSKFSAPNWPNSLIPKNAVLLCDKPAGITSYDLVASVKRELREAGVDAGRRYGPRVGHAGTLDPFATGLLVVLTGSSTRLQRYLTGLPKTYLARARLGWRSSTGDPDGELRETGRIPASLDLPTGRIMQRLPMTSAVKVDGERLYRKAHRGETIETPLREATVYEARLLRMIEGRPEYEITCSSGTYIRTLIETLQDAYCSSLRRIAVGGMRLVEGERREITPAEALAFLPRRELTSSEVATVGHGRPLAVGSLTESPRMDGAPAATDVVAARPATDPGGSGSLPVAMVAAGKLVAVARREGDNLRPEVVLV